MKVALLPDTHEHAGRGHVRRCQALAHALAALGCECAWPQDGQETVADVVIRDTYSSGDLCLTHEGVRVCFDDGQALEQDADVVVNGAPGAERLRYCLRDGAVALLGPQYLCLDALLSIWPPRSVRPVMERTLVSLGYKPSKRVVTSVLKSLARARVGEVAVCSEQPDSIIPLLGSSDLAVTGGGQTMLEAIALGIPTIAVCMAPNQRAQMDWLVQHGYVADGTEDLAAMTLNLKANFWLRHTRSLRGRYLIDGRGAERVARIIVERVKSQN